MVHRQKKPSRATMTLTLWLMVVIMNNATPTIEAESAGQGPVPPDQRAAIVRILNDRNLFGKDFPAALAYLPAWQRIGETRVHIFPDRIIGTIAYQTIEDARNAADRLTEAVAAPRQTPSQEFAELLSGVPDRFPFRVEVVPLFTDDGTIRIAWAGFQSTPGVTPRFAEQDQPAAQFFDPELTAPTVQLRVGPPEAVTREVIQTERDARPEVLRRNSYAGEAVAFTETDLSLRPGFIDRTIFSLPVIIAVVFVTGPSVR